MKKKPMSGKKPNAQAASSAKPSGHLNAKAKGEKKISAPSFEPLKPKIPDHQSFRIVGLGGVGCIVLRNLTTFLNSLQVPVHLCLIDGDEYEPSNVSRMEFTEYGNKAAVKAAEIKGLKSNSDSKLPHGAITTFEEYLTEDNIGGVISEDDIIFCCVDNHKTRKLINDHCATLKNVVLISGGNDGVDVENGKLGVYGNVQIYMRRDGKDVTAPLTQLHPEIREPKDKHPNELSCFEMASSTPQIFFANSVVANSMCNAFYALSCGRLTYQEVCFDILAARQLPQDKLPEPVSL